jgi:hypothetical protein
LPDLTISVVTNVSALPKSDVVNDANLARDTRSAIARRHARCARLIQGDNHHD